MQFFSDQLLRDLTLAFHFHDIHESIERRPQPQRRAAQLQRHARYDPDGQKMPG